MITATEPKKYCLESFDQFVFASSVSDVEIVNLLILIKNIRAVF